MAVVFPGKFVYLCTPHTASNATVAALKKIPGVINVKDPAGNVTYHSTLEQIRTVQELTATELVFSAVRNPYDSLVSWYLRNRTYRGYKPGLSFVEFFNEWMKRDPWPYVHNGSLFYHAPVSRIVMRYERGIEKEVNSVLRKIAGMPQVRLDLENETEGKDHWSTYYDEESYAWVNETFRDDIANFGYRFLWG